MIFEEKYLSCYILLTDEILLPLIRQILSNMCIVILCSPGCGVISFEINLGFLTNEAVFST